MSYGPVRRQPGQRPGIPGQLEHRHRSVGHRGGGVHPDLGDRLPGHLPNVDVPVLVMQGDADRILPFPNTGKRLPGLINDIKLVVIEGGPHGCCYRTCTPQSPARIRVHQNPHVRSTLTTSEERRDQ